MMKKNCDVKVWNIGLNGRYKVIFCQTCSKHLASCKETLWFIKLYGPTNTKQLYKLSSVTDVMV